MHVLSLSHAQVFCANMCEALPGVSETAAVLLIEYPLECVEPSLDLGKLAIIFSLQQSYLR